VLTLVSLLVRAIYLALVGSFAFIMAAGIGMGFDAGWNWFAAGIALLFLFTVIPALGIAFVPWSRLRRPGLGLKIWYGWIGLWLVVGSVWRGYVQLTQSVGASGHAAERLLHPERFTTICFRSEGKVDDTRGIYFLLGNEKRMTPERANPTSDCEERRMSEAPQRVIFHTNTRYISLEEGMRLEVPLVPAGKTCIVIAHDGTWITPHDQNWKARLVPCGPND
jgi:hypothetical protein